jgi:Rrf2 family transcriptional regulator, iron-sulfur cluster assembly transcription factor
MLSNSCKYGIRAVTYIASQQLENGNIGLKQIASALDLPTPFLAKILQLLAKQRILQSTKGPHGGFVLMKKADQITLYDIVKAIDGEDLFTHCVMHNNHCRCSDEEKAPCLLHDEYTEVRVALRRLFSGKTIANIVQSVNSSGIIEI